jgi:hypothetical protein
LNPHALRRRNLKAESSCMEDATSRKDEDAIGEERRAEHALGATGGNEVPLPDAVEIALADALTRASAAAQWDVVARLAGELEARRKARAGVVDLGSARMRRRGNP